MNVGAATSLLIGRAGRISCGSCVHPLSETPAHIGTDIELVTKVGLCHSYDSGNVLLLRPQMASLPPWVAPVCHGCDGLLLDGHFRGFWSSRLLINSIGLSY